LKGEDSMGMTNEEIAALMADDTSIQEAKLENQHEVVPDAIIIKSNEFELTQDEVDSLLSDFVAEDDVNHENLIDEIYEAILDSGKLSLMQWVKLRERLRQIEELVPHIDLIIRLKSKNEKKRTDF